MTVLYGFETYVSMLRTTLNFSVISIVCSTIIYSIFIFSRNDKTKYKNLYLTMLCVSLLGGLTGFSGGISRLGVVGDLIPAALTFLAGTVAYIFGIKENKNAAIPILVISFSCALFLNYSLGSKIRSNYEGKKEINERRLELCSKVFTSDKILSHDRGYQRASELFYDKCKPLFSSKNK